MKNLKLSLCLLLTCVLAFSLFGCNLFGGEQDYGVSADTKLDLVEQYLGKTVSSAKACSPDLSQETIDEFNKTMQESGGVYMATEGISSVSLLKNDLKDDEVQIGILIYANTNFQTITAEGYAVVAGTPSEEGNGIFYITDLYLNKIAEVPTTASAED